jgi:tRNA pseudouridine55 synthase
MLMLERRRVGPLTIDCALTVGEIATRQALGRLGDELMSLDQALDGLPGLVVDRQTAERVRHGVPVPASDVVRWEPAVDGVLERGTSTRIHDVEGHLLAIGKRSEQQNAIRIEKVLIGQD